MKDEKLTVSDGHKVPVPLPVLSVQLAAHAERFLRNHLSHIFDDKLSLLHNAYVSYVKHVYS